MTVELLPPAPPRALPALDAAQQQVAHFAGSALLVVGPPGSGKTVAALGAVRATGGVLLAPTRLAAGRAREFAADAGWYGLGQAPVEFHTPAALAYAIVRRFQVGQDNPAPSLITGAGQDEILAELLAGHAQDAHTPPWWPQDLPRDVLRIDAFRRELRDAFMRAAEFGLDGAELAQLGRERGVPEWELAGALYEEYLDTVALADQPTTRGERYDSARILAEAAVLLEHWEQFTPLPPPAFGRIAVDDYQESSAAVVRLLHACAARGAQLILLADPDVAVQTFRGARPQFVAQAELTGTMGGFGAERVELTACYRPALRPVVQAISQRVTAVAGVSRRRVTPPVPTPGGLAAYLLASPGAEAAQIARLIQEARLDRGLTLSDLAVIVRSGTQRERLVGALRRAGLPARAEVRATVLRHERVVVALLDTIAAGQATARGQELDGESAENLLTSAVGGLDTVGLRRLRRHLRTRVNRGDFPSIGQALAQVTMSEAAAETVPPEFHRPLARVRRILHAVATAPDTPPEALWAAWDASRLAGPWRAAALAGGPEGERADDDLDAVIALQAAAAAYAQRVPGSGALAFVDYVRNLALPVDTLASQAQRPDGVAVLTAAEAAGRSWPFVVIAGLQEGVWPDPRLRDSLLRSTLLAESLLGRGQTDRRRAVLDDEWRLFTAAVSRAEQALAVTAVESADERPSARFDVVADLAGGAQRPTGVEWVSLGGVVAALRSQLLDSPDGGADRVLAALAARAVRGADPSEWAGVADVTRNDQLPVLAVSPSRVELALTCPLRWALDAVGGRAGERIEASLGSVVHALAAAHPHGTEQELLAALEEGLAALELPDTWVGERERRRARRMVELLAAYVEGVPGQVDTEVSVDEELAPQQEPETGAGMETVRIVGRVDRVEHVDGGVRIADLKTGKALSAEQAANNMQLAVYQLAFGPRARGARLVYVTPDRAAPATRVQPKLPAGGGWAREKLMQAVTVMHGPLYPPVPNPGCQHCAVRTSCPAMTEGGRL